VLCSSNKNFLIGWSGFVLHHLTARASMPAQQLLPSWSGFKQFKSVEY
jgi:hypothetical protein